MAFKDLVLAAAKFAAEDPSHCVVLVKSIDELSAISETQLSSRNRLFLANLRDEAREKFGDDVMVEWRLLDRRKLEVTVRHINHRREY
ncbi:MAG: hypothetical protein HOE53_04700 [Candidatus Magasanikbacteria bacterium]|nr:hypothetical protein [Candidatus Magasanikbacteria bacterium]